MSRPLSLGALLFSLAACSGADKPGQIPAGLVERAVEAAWPGARTESIPAVPPLAGDGVATGGALTLAFPEHYPLRTAHEVDPLRPLIGALAGLGKTGHPAALQPLLAAMNSRDALVQQAAETAMQSTSGSSDPPEEL